MHDDFFIVCGAIHNFAGPDLAAECNSIGHCRTGDAVITGGYRLPAKCTCVIY